MELTREKLIVIIAGAAVIIAGGLYLFLYQPVIKEIKVLSLESRNTEAQISYIRRMITESEKRKIEKEIVNEETASLGIDELVRQGKARGISFVSITPKKIEKSETGQYKILPIGIEIKAGYKDLGAFLGALDELKKSLVIVKSFEIIAVKDEIDKLRARIVLSMYLASE
ncbi:MAG: type 4a pilus biogenesis protein PilO [Candidatus Omnitrophota bacterium]|nr:MAG: type 4a pilus biogenesis protein PilO [Candidatus Omnitrophota bacterium]